MRFLEGSSILYTRFKSLWSIIIQFRGGNRAVPLHSSYCQGLFLFHDLLVWTKGLLPVLSFLVYNRVQSQNES